MSEASPGRHFERLVLRNVRCFRATEIELDPRVTVLIGENGSGKTTLVEAMASLSYGKNEGLVAFPLAYEAAEGEIALFINGRSQPVAFWRNSGRRTVPRRLPKDHFFFAYGRYRRVHFPEDPGIIRSQPSSQKDLDELAARVGLNRTATVFRPDNHLLRDLARYLAALHFASQSDRRLDAIWKRLDASLAELGHGIQGITMVRGKTSYIPRVVRNGVPLELRELSDGYQAILVIVFDMILRYAYLFPFTHDPLLGEATVAIDEVDLHLHPRWQRTVVRQLVKLFPNTQFIFTTHSAAVVQGAIDARYRVITLEERTEGTEARALTPEEMAELEGAEIGSVLLEEKLFRLDSRYSPKYSAVEDRVAKIQKKASRGRATDEDKAQLFKDLDTLQSLVAADEERRADGSFLSQMTGLRKSFLEDLAAEIKKVKS